LKEVAGGEIEIADSKRMEKGPASRWQRSMTELTKVKIWSTVRLGMREAGV